MQMTMKVLTLLIVVSFVMSQTSLNDYKSECMNLDGDACLGERMKLNKKSLEDGILFDYSFNDMYMIDTKKYTQAYYFSVNSDKASEEFAHGPPSPIGSKYTLDLTIDSYAVFPKVVDKNVMTIRFWLFLKDANPDNTWKSLFRTQSTKNNDRFMTIQLWPTTNRLQFNIKTSMSNEIIDTNACLLSRRWYLIAVTIDNDKSSISIFINGVEDGKSMFLKGSRQNKNVEFNYVFGRTPEMKGVNAYLDRFQIYSRELETYELTPSYSFLQSTRAPFILQGCQSCDYSEAEMVCKNIRTVGIRTKDDFDKSDYAICSLEDLYLSEGWNTARIMGWFTPFSKDDDSGTIWIRDVDRNTTVTDKAQKKIALCCRKYF